MKHGFTLIEILVVVGIMGLLMAVGVASYNRMGDKAKAEQMAQLIVTNLRAAQKDADSGVGAVCNPNTGITASYAAGIITVESSCMVLRQVDLKLQNGIDIVWADPVTFLPLSKGIDPLPEPISVGFGASNFEINFTAAGGISVSQSQ